MFWKSRRRTDIVLTRIHRANIFIGTATNESVSSQEQNQFRPSALPRTLRAEGYLWAIYCVCIIVRLPRTMVG